jgi:UDP-N-acetylmuramate: L-alanyl-gamma-D-glutamyl-meso-diaminopimelate ligase
MQIYILGICGTFMAGLAMLARACGHQVRGCDQNSYPPMSTQLSQQGIVIDSGFASSHLKPAPDLVIIGNALSRGNEAVEYVLNQKLKYTSGPQFLAEHILAGRHVLGVAGTHGKTTSSSMLAWLLTQAKLQPGYLIGGIPANLQLSAEIGTGDYFVIEADEYDSAFFDKRSKFIHYRPDTLILNNLEYDHSDIFTDLAAIQRQFHYLVRTVPSQGNIISKAGDANLDQVLAQGCWTTVDYFGLSAGDWQARLLAQDGSHFDVYYQTERCGEVQWSLSGNHNVENALAALAAAYQAGVAPDTAIQALSQFSGVKRRMELVAEHQGIKLYDDFAHHPTAIKTTLAGLRAKVGQQPILVLLEPASNTMKAGVHQQSLVAALKDADAVLFYQAQQLDWDVAGLARACPQGQVFNQLQPLIEATTPWLAQSCHIVMMSNGSFAGLREKLRHILTA